MLNRKSLLFILSILLLTGGCSAGFRYLDAPPLQFKDFDYGFAVKLTSVDPSIAYVDEGKGGKTLVLVHGLASNAGFWRYNIAELAKSHRVIAIDLPGYGRSSKGDYPYGISYYASQVHALILELELENVVLVGHSMGGQIAIRYALDYPDGLDALVLAAPAGIEPFDRGAGDWLRSVITIDGVMKTQEDAIRRNLAGNFYRYNSKWEWMVEERARMAKADEMKEFAYAVTKSVDGMLDEPTTRFLSDISSPTLIVHGRYDGLIPNPYLNPGRPGDVFRAGHEAIAGSKLVEIDKAGHMLQIEKPDEFNTAVLSFVNGL